MPILSPKRQVTLPKDLCDRLHVQPGDDLLFVEHKGRITILKRTKGASQGLLKHVKAAAGVSDADSLESSLADRRGRQSRKRRAA